MIRAIDPTTGRLLEERPFDSLDHARALAADAARAQRAWRDLPVEARAALLGRLAAALRAGIEADARTLTREMGKPLAQARAEIEKCAWACEHFAAHAPAMLAPEPAVELGDGVHAYVVHRPLGVVLAIMPWNFPFWQLVRCAAPALVAGNAVVLKHAPNVPGSARALVRLFAEAGAPEGLFASVHLDDEGTGALIEDTNVAAVALTGSVRAGRAVAARAGHALKKCVLELGGSDGYVVLDDADLDAAAALCVKSRLLNGGQSCIAAKRFIVTRARAEAFEARVVAAMRALRMGDPAEPGTDLGPLAREDLRDALHAQVQASVARGARCALGGVVPERAGWWYPPTVLADVRPGMPAYEDELFGPVAAILPADSEEDALRIANDTRFGLGGAVLTADTARGELWARDGLDVGNAFVNELVRSDPRLPFGGVKDSGHGRELGRHGLLELTSAKTVFVRPRLT